MTPKLFAQKMYEGVRSVVPKLPHWDDLTEEMQLQVMMDVTKALKSFAAKK
ncbi:MAG: hypothetical protein HC903_27745 [Methylacidiphilales bacterium]|nr:hypothetical protein [Candidatus Methylacidiphilales bacterium]